jgi:dihydrodipicolinate synthase/N-acetylneuraminate lyase
MVGNEKLYCEGRFAGADGIVSGVSAAFPELIVAMEAAIRAGDRERARRFDAYLQQFMKWLEEFPGTVAIKQAAVARGWDFDHLAIPLDSRLQERLNAFRTWFSESFPSVLAECNAPVSARA